MPWALYLQLLLQFNWVACCHESSHSEIAEDCVLSLKFFKKKGHPVDVGKGGSRSREAIWFPGNTCLCLKWLIISLCWCFTDYSSLWIQTRESYAAFVIKWFFTCQIQNRNFWKSLRAAISKFSSAGFDLREYFREHLILVNTPWFDWIFC